MQHWQGEELARGWGYSYQLGVSVDPERWSITSGDMGYKQPQDSCIRSYCVTLRWNRVECLECLWRATQSRDRCTTLWVHTWFIIKIRSYAGGWVGIKTSRFPFMSSCCTLTLHVLSHNNDWHGFFMGWRESLHKYNYVHALLSQGAKIKGVIKISTLQIQWSLQ